MTSLPNPQALILAERRVRPEGAWPERIYLWIAMAMVGAFAVTLALHSIDPRTIDGDVAVWAKPLKFEFALALHAGTLALIVSCLSTNVRTGHAMKLVAIVFLPACAVEMGYIIAQAARGQHSHFNDSTPFHQIMFSVMAFSAVIIIGAAGAIGWAAAWDRGFSGSQVLRIGVVLGLIGGTILTVITAFTIGGRGGPYVGVVPDATSRMALTGWSQISGDLRVAHFLATHMIQTVPLFAALASRLLPIRTAMPIVLIFSGIWIAWVLLELRVARGGRPAILLDLLP